MVAWNSIRLLRKPHTTPTLSLCLLFLTWKVLLLAIALGPGPGYDTSTQLLLFGGYGVNANAASLEASINLPSAASAAEKGWWLPQRLVERLTRWDAIYFASIGARGRVYEQEWAFGWGWTSLLKLLGNGEYLLLHQSILRLTGLG
jgi:phosphatidylinositol glycan class V